MHRATLLLFLPAFAACTAKQPDADTASPTSANAKPASHTPDLKPTTAAEIGKPAPAFALQDLDGKTVKLSDYAGKTVVLEWFNPGCPFVKAAHTKGSLRDAAKRAVEKGVVWLSINSGGPGKQGHGVEANRAGASTFAMTNPILLDESGQVGLAYGATNTPNIFVVDSKGILVYAGAVDNSPDGEGESPKDGKLVSYVDQALAEIAAGKPVSVPKTQPYGCSVKYAKKS